MLIFQYMLFQIIVFFHIEICHMGCKRHSMLKKKKKKAGKISVSKNNTQAAKKKLIS